MSEGSQTLKALLKGENQPKHFTTLNQIILI